MGPDQHPGPDRGAALASAAAARAARDLAVVGAALPDPSQRRLAVGMRPGLASPAAAQTVLCVHMHSGPDRVGFAHGGLGAVETMALEMINALQIRH